MDNNNELTEDEQTEIGKLIQNGYTSGLLENEDYKISWEIKFNKINKNYG